MNFASLDYLQFLVVVWVAYVALPWRGQNLLLLGASYYFYGQWDWRFLSLIVASTLTDYIVGSYLGRAVDRRRRKAALTVSVVFNLGLLGVFKYYNFFVDSLVEVLSATGFEVSRPALTIVLPVGISFYTFQTMSYTIDIYRKKLTPTRDFPTFALFVVFFPQLVAGPIERAKHLLPLLARRRRLDAAQVTAGLRLIALGLMKKIAIADGLSRAVDAIYGTSQGVSATDIALATYAFAFQILTDFSAYTDIARGTSKLFGLELMENFRAPYFASTPSDFWRRWHISLSTWLRDYLYIPLGGNRGGAASTYKNLMLTMLLGGLWHGAAWNFIAWGAYQGILLCAFRLMGAKEEPAAPRLSFGKLLKTAMFFQLVCFGWLLFRAESMQQIVAFTAELLSPASWGATQIPRPPLSALIGVPLLIMIEALTFRCDSAEFYRRWPRVLQGVLFGAIVITMLLGMSNAGSDFIYFQF